jgi:hypothetical protein
VQLVDDVVLLDAVLSNAEQLDEDMPPGSPITFVLRVEHAEGIRLRQAITPFVDDGVLWALGRGDGLEGTEIGSLLLTAESQPTSILVTM